MEELDWLSIKSGLLDMARKRGAEVARVGDPALLEDAEPGLRPSELLTNVKSMIVLGGAAPRAAEWESTRVEVMETVGTADRMTALGSSLARHIEETYGYYAMNVPTATDQDDKAFLDFKAAPALFADSYYEGEEKKYIKTRDPLYLERELERLVVLVRARFPRVRLQEEDRVARDFRHRLQSLKLQHGVAM